MRTWIILNPTAGSGRALQAGQRLADLIGDAELHRTEAPGHATLLARRAHDQGVETVVAVGGDGTIQEVAEGLCLDASGGRRPAGPRLALLPSGTGGDYRRSHGLTDAVEQAATRIRSPLRKRLDVGYASCHTADGSRRDLVFVNALTFGVGGLTDRLVESAPKWIGGRAAFFLGAVRATLVYRPVPVELEIDGQKLPLTPYTNVAICVGRYIGGGMKVAPNAELDDGLFDIITFEGDKLQTLGLSATIYRGTHLKSDCVRHFRGCTLRAVATRPGEVLVDADGNQPGSLPLEVDIMPGALTLAL